VRLYLVQHGEALPEEKDPERHLTTTGERDVKKVARFLKPLQLSVAEVWHSGKARAAQTAEFLAPSLAGKAKMVRREGLAPKDAVRPLREAVERFGEDLMIVSHLPLLEKLAASLVTGDKTGDVVGFQYGCVVCLDNATEDGNWQVAWMVVPELIGR
jgi:phosphohistidine phosphatase